MGAEVKIVSGWVLAVGDQLPGRSVRLRVTDTHGGAALSESASLPSGQFAVAVPTTPDRGSLLVVEAVDSGRVIGRQEVREERPTVLILERELSEENTTGPTLLLGSASDLVRCVARLETDGQLPVGVSGVLYAVLGRLHWLNSLLEPARRAILGDTEAAAIVRETLGGWAQEIAAAIPDADVNSDDDARAVPDTLISKDAVGTLASAVFTSGRTAEEQIELADGLVAVLSVRSWLEVLAGAAAAGDVPAMRVMMGAPGPIPLGVPGFGGLPGGGLARGGLPGGNFPGLPKGFPHGKPKVRPVKVHPTVADVLERFRSPIMFPPSDKERCLIGAMVDVAALRASAPTYQITGMTPVDGCPGAEITIIGRNFGTHGSVVFPGTAAPVPNTGALEWTDRTIRLVIPEGAGPGPITLSILEAALFRCGQMFSVFRTGGSDLSFEGGTAAVRSFLLDGTADPLRVDPGELVVISCNVTVHEHAQTRIWVSQDGATIADFGRLAGGGQRMHDFTAPTPNAPVVCIVHLVVSGPCGEVDHQRRITVAATPHLHIVHLEVTQGLQNAKHTVRLVSGRTTGVRAYLTSGLGGFSYTGLPGEVANVTGMLHVERGGVVVASMPAARAVTVGDTFSDADRSSVQHALVFEAAGGLMDGDVTMRVSARAVGLPGFGTNAPGTSTSRTVHTERAGTITVVRLRMRLTNPAHPAAEPSVAAWRTSSVGTQDRYPLSDTGMLVRVPATGDVLSTNHFLGKDDGWHDTLDDLDDFADRFDDFTSIFACTVPAGNFSLNGTSHAANDRIWPLENDRRCFLAQAGLRATFAHEMAHTLGVGHAPCGNPDGVDTRLPGSTEPGVVGWRTSDDRLMPPMWSELMSYCTPSGAAWATRDDRWPSVALWHLLLDQLK